MLGKVCDKLDFSVLIESKRTGYIPNEMLQLVYIGICIIPCLQLLPSSFNGDIYSLLIHKATDTLDLIAVCNLLYEYVSMQ